MSWQIRLDTAQVLEMGGETFYHLQGENVESGNKLTIDIPMAIFPYGKLLVERNLRELENPVVVEVQPTIVAKITQGMEQLTVAVSIGGEDG